MLYHFQVIWRWIIVTLKRLLKIIQTERLGAVSYSPSMHVGSVCCIMCEIKRDIGRKSWFFHTPLHLAPPLGGSPSEYCYPVWYGKTRMVGLHSIPACDIQTDGRTGILSRHSPCYAYASCDRPKNDFDIFASWTLSVKSAGSRTYCRQAISRGEWI